MIVAPFPIVAPFMLVQFLPVAASFEAVVSISAVCAVFSGIPPTIVTVLHVIIANPGGATGADHGNDHRRQASMGLSIGGISLCSLSSSLGQGDVARAGLCAVSGEPLLN